MGSALARNTKNRGSAQPFVWLAAVSLLAFMLLASVTGPTRVWTIPQDGPTELFNIDSVPKVPVVTVRERSSKSTAFGLSVPPELVVALVTVLFVGFAVLAIRALGLPVLRWSPRRRRRQAQSIDSVLPDPMESVVQVDIEAAQSALVGGHSKDAIIRCWMQVQTDITDAGYEPVVSETSAEYVERVITQASVDPTPIAALASLYREARFSRHELTEAHRSQAAAAVSAVAASLSKAEKGDPYVAPGSSTAIVESQ